MEIDSDKTTYRIEVGCPDSLVWQSEIKEFLDYSIYQTLAYQNVRAEMDKQTLLHILIKNDNDITCLMCIVRIKNIKPIGFKIGYIQWGPLIRKANNVHYSRELFKCLSDHLLKEYVNVLRVTPNIYKDYIGKQISETLKQAGFISINNAAPYRTMLLPLEKEEEDLRNSFHRQWRKLLRKADKQNIEIRHGTGVDYFKILEDLYFSAKKRKGFIGLDSQIFLRTQKLLPESEKMDVIVAYVDGTPVSAHISSNLGEITQGVLAATSTFGLSVASSYLVWWETLLESKRKGMLMYDLGGFDPIENPGVYKFKSRMGADEAFHIGCFDAYANKRSQLLWLGIEKVYQIIKG